MPVVYRVTLDGPVFKGAPAKIRKAVGDILQEAVEAGEKRLDEMLRKRPAGVYLAISTKEGGSVGNYRRNVEGEVQRSTLRALITDGGVIYGPWLEGVGSRNATTRFKGYAAFRKTGQWLRENIDEIAGRVIKKFVRKLN